MNLRDGRRGEALVAAAGPVSNLVLAAIVAVPVRLMTPDGVPIDLVLHQQHRGRRLQRGLPVGAHQRVAVRVQPAAGAAARRLEGAARTWSMRGRPGASASSEQYAIILLLAILLFGGRDHPAHHRVPARHPGPGFRRRPASAVSSWWAGRIRQFRRHLAGRVDDADRAGLGEWLTPRQVDLFESMHRADQRHGLDVVASLRSEGHRDPDLLLAGLFHDASKGPSVGRLAPRGMVAWRALRELDPRGRRSAARIRGPPSSACATTPNDRRSWLRRPAARRSPPS